MILQNKLSSKLILASESLSRQKILKNAGLDFDIIPSNVDEIELKNIYQNERKGLISPEEVALFLAERKALCVSTLYPDALIIGCDQILSLSNQIFHKPMNMLEAFDHLSTLSGKTHSLSSGIVLMQNKIKIWECVDRANLKMRILSEKIINQYLDCVQERVLKTVGAYEIEGQGIQLFEEMNGNYFTIRGLPLLPLLQQLRQVGTIE